MDGDLSHLNPFEPSTPGADNVTKKKKKKLPSISI